MKKILLILLLWSNIAAAQDTLLFPVRTAGLARSMTLSGISHLSYNLPDRTEAQIGFNGRSEREPLLQQEGSGLAEGYVDVKTGVRFNKNTRLLGGATYRRGVKRNVRWNTTSDFMLLYPYVLADSTGGDLQSETYAFHGSYVLKKGKAIFGLRGKYRALHEYRQVDPRPRNITSDFNAAASVGYDLGTVTADLTASYRKYHQLQSVDFYNNRGASTSEMHFTGLGSHYGRFASTGTYVNTRYKGNGFSTSLGLRSNGGEGWTAGLGYTYFDVVRHLINQNEAPFSNLAIQQADAFVFYRRLSGRIVFSLGADARYECRLGTENVIDNLAGGMFNTLIGITQYRNDIIDVALSGCLERGPWNIMPILRFYSTNAAYKDPSRRMLISSCDASVRLGWAKSQGQRIYKIAGTAGYITNINSSIHIPSAFTDPVIKDFYDKQFQNQTKDRFHTTLEALFQTSRGLWFRTRLGLCSSTTIYSLSTGLSF